MRTKSEHILQTRNIKRNNPAEAINQFSSHRFIHINVCEVSVGELLSDECMCACM